MNGFEFRVREAVMAEASKVREKYEFYKNHPDIKRAINLTTDLLIKKGKEHFKDKKQLKFEVVILFAVSARSIRFKYFNTYSSAEELIIKSSDIMLQYGTDHYTSHKQVIREAKEVVEKEFFSYKINKISSVYEKVMRYAYGIDKVENPSDAVPIEDKDIVDIALDTFVKNYDPESESWKKFFDKIVSDTKINYGKQMGKIDLRAPFESEDPDDYELTMDKFSDKNNEDPRELNTLRSIEFCEMLRDLVINCIKLKLSSRIQYSYYSCFYTDYISELIDESKHVYEHVKENYKLYHPAVNIDFLNYFVDSLCEILLDAYKKPRKNLTCNEKNCKCDQPLQLAVYSSFLGKDISSVSLMRDKYNNLLSNQLKEKLI